MFNQVSSQSSGQSEEPEYNLSDNKQVNALLERCQKEKASLALEADTACRDLRTERESLDNLRVLSQEAASLAKAAADKEMRQVEKAAGAMQSALEDKGYDSHIKVQGDKQVLRL